MESNRKLLIIGACGIIGTHIASLTAEKFKKVILVDIEPMTNKLKAISKDLQTQFTLENTNTEVYYTTNYDEIDKLSENDVIVIPAGKARDPNDKNSTREALFEFNRKIVDGIGKTLKEKIFLNKDKQPLIIVVTNPVDSILKSMIRTNNLDPKKTIGSGNQLDTIRFKQNLAKLLKININDIENAFVIGQHGKNMVYCLDEIKIKGEFLYMYLTKNNISIDLIKEVCEKTTNEGGEIIANAGATCFGPAGSVKTIINSFINNKNEIFSLSIMHSNGDCYGYPIKLNKDGAEIIDFKISNEEQIQLNNSIESINSLL